MQDMVAKLKYPPVFKQRAQMENKKAKEDAQ